MLHRLGGEALSAADPSGGEHRASRYDLPSFPATAPTVWQAWSASSVTRGRIWPGSAGQVSRCRLKGCPPRHGTPSLSATACLPSRWRRANALSSSAIPRARQTCWRPWRAIPRSARGSRPPSALPARSPAHHSPITRHACCRGWRAPRPAPGAIRGMGAHSKASGDPPESRPSPAIRRRRSAYRCSPSGPSPPGRIPPPYWCGCMTGCQSMDPRNDSQTLFTDQLIPGSVLLGYLNADHWAVALPLDQAHPLLAATFTNRNAFPRALHAAGRDAHRRRDAAGASTMTRAAALIMALGLFACAAPRPFEPHPAAPELRAEMHPDGLVAVMAAALGAAESRERFGVSLHDAGVQPVWLRIVNDDRTHYWLLPTSIDRDYFLPSEAVRRAAGRRASEDLIARVRGAALPVFIPPRSEVSGVIFTRVDEGLKALTVQLVGPGVRRDFPMVLPVPGLRRPPTASRERIYPGQELPDLRDDRGLVGLCRPASLLCDRSRTENRRTP